MDQPEALTFIVFGTPISQGSKRIVGTHREGLTRARLIDVNSVALKQWRHTVAMAASVAMTEQRWTTLADVPIHLTASFTYHPPKILEAKIRKAPHLPYPCHKTPDLDKALRAVMDAVTEAGVWVDDRLVARITSTKSYAGGAGALPEPGVVVGVREWRP